MLVRTFYSTTISVISLMFVVLISLPVPADQATTEQQQNNNSKSLLIKNASIFNGEEELVNRDIEIRDGVIQQLTNNLIVNDAEIIDAHGKTIIPGLIDAHTHSFENALRATVKFGVTTHVDMFSHPSLLPPEKEKRLTSSQSTEADLFSAGVLATSDEGHGTQFGLQVDTINSPGEAKKWVARRMQEGSDFIKIVYMPYSTHFKSIDRATATAIIDAAHELKLQAVAHVSSQRAAQELLEDGIDGLVHIFADEKVSDEFIRLAKSNNVFVIPTLSVIATAANENLGAKLANNPLIKPYLEAGQYQQLQSTYGDQEIPGFDLSIALHNVQRLHQASITMLAGSDAPNPGTAYGASIHQELELLTRAGLTPTEALRAATTNVSERFNLVDRGRIEVGMKADLVLLNSNPLSNIMATRDIHAIYKNGQPVERKSTAKETASSDIGDPALSDFGNSLESPSSFIWSKTDDAMAGGQSSASISLKNQLLSVDATVNSGFIFPWAGASAFAPLPVNISKYSRLQFRVRGTLNDNNSGAYQVMMFSGTKTGTPPSQSFEVSPAWQTITLELENFRGLDVNKFYGLAIVAGPSQGEFKYQLDDVKLLP